MKLISAILAVIPIVAALLYGFTMLAARIG